MSNTTIKVAASRLEELQQDNERLRAAIEHAEATLRLARNCFSEPAEIDAILDDALARLQAALGKSQ
jgi:hypothetical protein